MTINELKNKIGKDYYYRGDYHTIESFDLLDFIDSYFKDDDEYNDIMEVIGDNGYLIEYADGRCPIYYHDIAKWFGDNWNAVNDYIEYNGVDSKDFDIMRTIQCAWVDSYREDFTNALDNILQNDK